MSFTDGLPTFPLLRNRTDNTATLSWVNDIRTTSPLARALVDMYGQLMKRSTTQCSLAFIPGDENLHADYISRPTSLSHQHLLSQIFHKLPWMRDLLYFQPSADLLSALQSALLCNSKKAPSLPTSLGQFVHIDSTSSAFCVV